VTEVTSEVEPGEGRAFLGEGVAFPLGVDGAGRIIMNRLEDQVRQSIRLILSTARGERVMRPELGGGMEASVFDPASPATAAVVRHEVKETLTRFEPRIEVLDVDVDIQDGERNVLLVTLTYRVRRTDTVFNLVYPFYLERGER
jgi:phage baseplate assembly protein W